MMLPEPERRQALAAWVPVLRVQPSWPIHAHATMLLVLQKAVVLILARGLPCAAMMEPPPLTKLLVQAETLVPRCVAMTVLQR